MEKVFVFILAAAFCINGTGLVFAADPEKTSAKSTMTTAAPKAAAAAGLPAVPQQKANFAVISGTVTKIDNADPENIKLEVKNDSDGVMHVIQVTPWTNITKVTDTSEIKIGEAVRVMSRRTEDKETALGIMFGKMRRLPQPMAAPVKAAAGPAAPIKQK